ncbi:MAG: GUN4 domain-containing protein [Phormidium tanganyikae FI6-MK23]|nr:GUN4 domain-containing protein [Phormidium tanganyikae FI6-MK23]
MPPEPTPEKSLSDKITDALTKLLVLGSGGYAVYSLVDEEIPKALISGAVSVGTALMTSFGEGLMKVLKESMSQRGEKSGKAIDKSITNVEKSATHLRERIFSPKKNYLNALKTQCTMMESEGETLLSGGIPLKDVYVPLQVVSSQIQGISRAPQQIWAFLPGLQSREVQHRRIAIAAGAGAGKTTLLRYLTLCYVTEAYRLHQVREDIPVLLRFRDIFAEIPLEGTIALPELILKSLAKQPEGEDLKASRLWFEEQLKQGRCLVMFDGLDEVPKSQRHRIKKWIDYQMKRYGKTRFILTSRPAGLELEDEVCNLAQIEVDTSLQVLPFNPDDIDRFVQQWYRALIAPMWNRALEDNPRKPVAERLDAEAVEAEIGREVKKSAESLTRQIFASSALTGLARTPLLVKLIAITHDENIELPKRRVSLYKDICDVLLRKRATKFSDRRTPLELEDKLALLQVLAWNLMQQEVNTFCMAQGSKWIQERFRQACADEAIKPKQFLIEVIEIAGLIVEQEHDTYEFSHQTFQEYFAALYLKAQGQESLLVEKVTNDRWLEVCCFSASMGQTTRLVNAALDEFPSTLEKNKPHLLKLMTRCQNEGVPIDSATSQRLDRALLLAAYKGHTAAELRLQTRFQNVQRVGQADLCLDYITWGEYRLFLDAQETKQYHSQAKQIEILIAEMNEPVKGISWQDAQWFCNWVSSLPLLQSPDQVYDYRLPTSAELEAITSTTIEGLIPFIDRSDAPGNSIKIVRMTLPERYTDLHNYLANGRWKDADQETDKVMLKVPNQTEQGYLDVQSIQKFPCEDLQIIDRLWVKFSLGHFGFSVQKQIYVETGNSLDGQYHKETYERFGDRIGWRRNRNEWINYSEVTFDTFSLKGHLPAGMEVEVGGWRRRNLFSRAETCEL